MLNKGMLVLTNIITGIIVFVLSILAFGISGMAEGPRLVDTYFWLLLGSVWIVGLILQFIRFTRVIGLIITFVPIFYHLYNYVTVEFI